MSVTTVKVIGFGYAMTANIELTCAPGCHVETVNYHDLVGISYVLSSRNTSTVTSHTTQFTMAYHSIAKQNMT